MKVGMIGLGKMGHAIARRMIDAGHTVFGFDIDKKLYPDFERIGGHAVDALSGLYEQVTIFWLMVPVAGVDQLLDNMILHLRPDSIIIDGGNSYYKDSIIRAQKCAQRNISFIDCGTSGGIHGAEYGFCLMIGGSQETYVTLQPLFHAVAAPEGVAYIGNSGAGHYVKMIHNGIEYGILQAYAEGFQLLKEGTFKDQLDLATVAKLWNHGSIIRSFILQLAHQVLEKDQILDTVGGAIQELGTGQWALQEARESRVTTPVLEQSLQVRVWSRSSGGNFATKLVALLRNAFGGHSILRQK